MKQKNFLLFNNQDFLIAQKPSGIPVIPERWADEECFLHMLEKITKEKLFVVHRIDKVTSGLIIFAKNPKAHQKLSLAFQEQKVHKEYLALTQGIFGYQTYTANFPIQETKSGKSFVDEKGKPSLTHFELVQNFQDYSLVCAKPITGRTHQIRVHLAYLGVPIVCDTLYGFNKPLYLSQMKRKNFKLKYQQQELPLIQRTALHAWKLSFDWNNTPMAFECPYPKDFKAAIHQLSKYNKPIKEIFFG